MERMVLGLFDEKKHAEMAIDELENAGYNLKDLSIIMRSREEAEKIGKGADVVGGAASGATTGGVVGGLAGLLVGVGAITIPGIGPFLFAGPIATALGLTGAAASTVSGAVSGALAGGLIGALVRLGLPEEEAKVYEARIKEGAILLAVPVRGGNEMEIREILEKHTDEVKVIGDEGKMTSEMGQRAETYGPSYASDVQERPTRTESLTETFDTGKFLENVRYPANKEELLDQAKENMAPEDVLQMLKKLPDHVYNSSMEVMEEINKV